VWYDIKKNKKRGQTNKPKTNPQTNNENPSPTLSAYLKQHGGAFQIIK